MKQNIIIVLLSAICGLLGYMAAQRQDVPAVTAENAAAAERSAEKMIAEAERELEQQVAAVRAEAGISIENKSRNCTKLDLPNPPYPEDAQNAGIGGKVSLEFEVSDEGKGQNVNIIKSSGNASLDNAALRAVKGARYSKGEIECVRTSFNFRHY